VNGKLLSFQDASFVKRRLALGVKMRRLSMSFGLILVHVFCGVFWAGGAVLAGLFLIPALLEAGPAGGAVMGGLLRRKMAVWLSAAAALNVLTGLGLFHLRWSALGGAWVWVLSPEGLVLTLGSLLGLAAFGMGLFVQKPTAERLAELGRQVAQSGGKPSPEQAETMQALQRKLAKVARVGAWHLVASVLCMASHRLAATL
jgi:uncharacterized membrane protein